MKVNHHPSTSKSVMSTKSTPSTPASPVTTNGKKNFVPLTAVKKSSFWDEEDEDVIVEREERMEAKEKADKIEQQLKDLKANGVEVYAVDRQVKIESLLVMTNVSKAPLLIIDQLGKDWKDLLCYNYELRTTLHLKREDLLPRETVDAVITFLQNVKR